MPWLPSPEFAERMRAPLTPPFDKWRPWQRYVFACGAILLWLMLAGAAGIGLAAYLHLPACPNTHADLFGSNCHTTTSVALCAIALVILIVLYLKYFELMCQITYIRRSNYGIDED
jgi:hypothetical protein